MKYLKIIVPIVVVSLLIGGVFFLTRVSPDSSAAQPLPAADPVHPLLQGEGAAPSNISKIPILTYHSFGPKPDFKENKTQLQYRVTAPMFEKQMKNLSEKNYTPITFADLVENQISGKPLPENPIVITFDDGWKSQYEYALPILKKYNFTATFFIITHSIGAKAYMTADELKELHAQGFEIASHTKTHPKLPLLDDAKLIDEINGSKKNLEDQLGISIKTLAYPYYAHDARVMKAVADAGYRGARAGWGNFKNDTQHLFEFVSQESVNNPDPFASTRIAD